MSFGPSSSTPTPSRCAIEPRRLTGPSVRLDPRINAWRPDLADIALAGRVIAARYAEGVLMRGRVAAAPLLGGPSADAEQVSELLAGEGFTVFDQAGGHAWGQVDSDAYVGWVDAMALGPAGPTPGTRITAPDALVFAEPSIKARVLATLPLNARIIGAPHDTSFIAVARGFVHRRHIAPTTGDAAALATAFLGTPYRWGGRTRAGVDCSGLVQAVLLAHGVACPRDTDQQRAAFAEIDPAERRRGDLVFFPGHVGMLTDPDHLLHANAYWMTTLIEPLADVVARLRADHADPIVGVRRPPCGGQSASL